jgi:hypothetical protein
MDRRARQNLFRGKSRRGSQAAAQYDGCGTKNRVIAFRLRGEVGAHFDIRLNTIAKSAT